MRERESERERERERERYTHEDFGTRTTSEQKKLTGSCGKTAVAPDPPSSETHGKYILVTASPFSLSALTVCFQAKYLSTVLLSVRTAAC